MDAQGQWEDTSAVTNNELWTKLKLFAAREVDRMQNVIEKLENSQLSNNVAGVLTHLDLTSTQQDIQRLESLIVQMERRIIQLRSRQ
jgi:copper homeostasis protein CutC